MPRLFIDLRKRSRRDSNNKTSLERERSSPNPWPKRLEDWLRRGLDRCADWAFHRYPMIARVLGVVALGIVVYLVGRWAAGFVDPGDAEERTNLLTAFAQIAGGAALLLGLWYTAQTYRTNLEGQITERFTRAIDHLGDEELTIRLGGVYSLERIARDSPRDQRQIVEILTTLIRDTTPVSERRRADWWELVQAGKDLAPPLDPVPLGGEPIDIKRNPASDIQAILTVLGRRERGPGRQEPRGFNLAETDLRGVHWSDAYLPYVILSESDLEGAWLIRANLTEATLMGANLRDAKLGGALLTGAWLQHVYAFKAFFDDADFRETANARRANLHGSILSWAHFWDAKLSGMSFSNCNLDHASFFRARMDRVSFHEVSLIDTDFTKADLTNADFRGVDLSRCRGLTQEQLDKAGTDAKTKFPAT